MWSRFAWGMASGLAAVLLTVPSVGMAGDAGAAPSAPPTTATDGHRLFQAGQFEKAAVKLEAATRSSKDPELLFELAVCYERLDRDTEAIATFRAYRQHPVSLRTREADQHIQSIEAKQSDATPEPVRGIGKVQRVIVPINDDSGKCYRSCAPTSGRCGNTSKCWAIQFSCLRSCPGARVESGSCLTVQITSTQKCVADRWP